MADAPIVTRFAPSPTGHLHIGGARTALLAWAYARGRGGRFILRMEDTDQSRSSAESTRAILGDLRWLGLDWDQGPDAAAEDPYQTQIGEHGPYFQSQRLEIYHEHVERLIKDGLAYEDGGAVRFAVREDVVIDDQVFGRVEVKASDVEDFVIRKRDGYPTFHMAVVVDDALMGVTHVLRGQEHLSNTPKHVALQKALGFATPTYAHMPSIMNPDGSKMSKRDKAKAARAAASQSQVKPQQLAELTGLDAQPIEDFLAKTTDDLHTATAIAGALKLALPEINVADFARSGYLPEVLLNYLALLGWNPGGDVERFDLEFLKDKFELDRIGKSNSKFDRDKLLAFNYDTLTQMPAAAFEARLRAHFEAHHPALLAKLSGERFALFAAAYQPRAHTLDEPAQLGAFVALADDEIDFDEKAVKKVLAKNENEGVRTLAQLRPQLEALSDWQAEPIHDLVKSFAEQNGLGMGKVAQPLRVALTGTTVSPSIDQTLVLLGKESVLARIDRCVATFGLGSPKRTG